MLSRLSGPALVALAAFLWGTDSLFRFPTAAKLDPTFIVFVEHVVGIAILLPWVWSKHRKDAMRQDLKGWLALMIVGAGGGAIATTLFTASFRYLNPSIAVLLQKLQPIFVVMLAYGFLGERPAPKFYPWAAVALAAGFVLSFPDLNLSFLNDPGNLQTKGVLYAMSACMIWGVSTVAGRSVLLKTPSTVASFWRYAFGTMMLTAILWAAHIPLNPEEILASRETFTAMMYLSIVTGLIPILVYYKGMARTPASVATFIESLYPVGAVILNTVFLHTPLTPVQMIAGGVLLFAVAMISI